MNKCGGMCGERVLGNIRNGMGVSVAGCLAQTVMNRREKSREG